MVAGNSAVILGQLAAWHSLYLAHPAEQFMSTHKQDCLCENLPLFRWGAGGIGRDKANGWRGACDGAKSMCYLCLFSVTAFGPRKANISSSLTQYVRQCEERGGDWTRPHWLHVNFINPSGLFSHQRHNDAAVNHSKRFVTYADSLYARDVILAAAPTCGQNEMRSRHDSFRD